VRRVISIDDELVDWQGRWHLQLGVRHSYPAATSSSKQSGDHLFNEYLKFLAGHRLGACEPRVAAGFDDLRRAAQGWPIGEIAWL